MLNNIFIFFFIILSFFALGSNLKIFYFKILNFKNSDKNFILFFGLSTSIIAINYLVLSGIDLSTILILLNSNLLLFFIFNFKKINFNYLKNFTISDYLFFFMAIILFIKILFEPVTIADAKAIWFYSGKIIFYNEGFNFENFIQGFEYFKKEYVIYPKLISSLSALIAKNYEIWNDYLPKISIFLIFLPSFFFIMHEFTNAIDRIFVFTFVVLSNGFYLWNGYMDAYFAIYSCLSFYCLIKFFENKKDKYFISFVVFTILVINLKIEFIFLLNILLFCNFKVKNNFFIKIFF